MCLIVFNYKNHPEYDLILAANRDEFYGRPSRAARFWDHHPNLLAGKDLKSGGSWMGINRGGQIAALTNYRDPSITKQDPPSRGEIITKYLTQQKGAQPFLKNLHQQAGQYMGFNVLAGTAHSLYHYSNCEGTINPIKPGLHGLSNKLLDTPWPKVESAKSNLSNLLQAGDIQKEGLFEILKDDTPAPDDRLPDTGVPAEIEKQVSPIFIKGEDYGTRSSTVLLVDKNGTIDFTERRFAAGTDIITDEQHFEITV